MARRSVAFRSTSPRRSDAKIAHSVTAFQAWRDVPGRRAAARLVRLFGEELRGQQGGAQPSLVSLEAGQEFLQEGLGGSAGDESTSATFAVGLFAPALYGPDHRVGASRPPHDGDLAIRPVPVAVISALQLSRRGVGRGTRALASGLRRQRGIWKAEREDPADRARLPGAVRAPPPSGFADAPAKLSQIVLGGPRRRRNIWPRNARHPGGQRHRFDPHGPRACAHRRRARLRQNPILELGGKQRDDRWRPAPSSISRCVPSCSPPVGNGPGQRCTSLRRLFVHDSIYDKLVARLEEGLCRVLPFGDPLASRHAGRPR